MKKILILNGPSLNLLGSREPAVYGTESMAECLAGLRRRYPALAIDYAQSNHEGALIDALQAAAAEGPEPAGVVLNAGAYTHTSLALADAIRALPALTVVEVHLSNVAAREPVRHTSLIAPACRGTITGFGTDVYRLAIEALLAM